MTKRNFSKLVPLGLVFSIQKASTASQNLFARQLIQTPCAEIEISSPIIFPNSFRLSKSPGQSCLTKELELQASFTHSVGRLKMIS